MLGLVLRLVTTTPAVEVVELDTMGSRARVTLHDAPVGLAGWAVDELGRLHGRWSRFLPDSELSRLNAAAGTGPVPVHPSTLVAVSLALRAATELGPWFDPTILDALEALGYDRTFPLVEPDGPEPVTTTGPSPGPGGIEVDPDAGTVALPRGVRIDLGGVGKGLAADLVAEGLVDRGARGAAVGIGGDVRVGGEAPPGLGEVPGRWPIPVRDPSGDGYAFTANLAEGDGSAAIVTSTRSIRRWRRAGVEHHHLVDPRTGASAAGDVAAAVVLGPSAAWAEAVAKAAVIAGAAEGALLVERTGCHGWLAGTGGGALRPTFS